MYLSNDRLLLSKGEGFNFALRTLSEGEGRVRLSAYQNKKVSVYKLC